MQLAQLGKYRVGTFFILVKNLQASTIIKVINYYYYICYLANGI